MRTFLHLNTGNKTRKRWQSIALALGLVAFVNFANAQVDMTWTGASSNNFVIEDNWDPAGSPEGNNVTIPMPDTTSATGSPDAQPFAVEVTGAENISVNIMEIVYATENAYQSTFTVNLDNDETTFTNSTRDADYNHTGVIIKRGHYMYTRGNGARFDSDNSWLRVEGGIAEYYNLLMGNGNSPSSGGKLYISGGEVRLNDTFGRIYTGREDGQVEITGDGMLTISGNFIAPTENWINGGEDYSIKRGYDAVADKTTYTAVPASYIGIENSDRQVLKSGEASTDTLHLIQTSSVVDATTFEWRYRAEGQETYTSFTDDNSATFAPQFDTPGTFFVSCLVDGVETENEVEFFVVSNAISFSPAEFPVQFVRIGENGTEITAEFTTTPTSMEWKYSHTPGGPYVSFDPVQTSATLAPSFEETGNTYVVMIAQIDGATHTSVELFYNVEEESTSGKSLTWTGLASEEGTNPANWNPVANPYKNSLAIGAFDSPSTLPYPVYEPVGNDTISTFWVGPGAKMTINSQDTVNIRGGWQQAQGNLIIQNGIITNSGYFRLDRATGKVELYNDSKMFIEQLLMGERSTDGGTIHLNDNAVLHCLTLPGRVSPDTLQSVTYISDNASIEYVGDVQSDVNVWISSAKIVCPDENFEPYVTFDGELTIVTARNTNAFAIENASLDFTTPNTPISEDISLVNVDGITSWEWKWSESVNGPWNSFEPAAVDESTYAPAFAESGIYYVVAVTSEDVQTTNMKEINVVDLSVSPADEQEITEGAVINPLTVNIPSEVTFLSGMWLIEDAGGNIEETGVGDTEFTSYLSAPGTYYVYFYAEVQDIDGNSYILYTNKVTVVYGSTSVDDIGMNLKLYPNPTTGKFFINTNFDSNYTVEIINVAGVSVYKKEFTQSGSQAISFNKKGAYIVKVQSENKTQFNRLIIK